MQKYKNAVDKVIKEDLGYTFKPADPKDLEKLAQYNLPKDIIDFYRHFEPHDHEDGGPVRLLKIKGIIEENTDYIPGCQISKLGFIVFATTLCGNAICFNLNKTINNEITIAHVGHGEDYSDWTPENVLDEEDSWSHNKTICQSFYEFLTYFANCEDEKLDLA